jgi:hypothetical protein
LKQSTTLPQHSAAVKQEQSRGGEVALYDSDGELFLGDLFDMDVDQSNNNNNTSNHRNNNNYDNNYNNMNIDRDGSVGFVSVYSFRVRFLFVCVAVVC